MKSEDLIEKYCKYCEKAYTLSDPNQMLCWYCGVVSAAYVCRRFRFDPLKRQPKRLSTVTISESVDYSVSESIDIDDVDMDDREEDFPMPKWGEEEEISLPEVNLSGSDSDSLPDMAIETEEEPNSSSVTPPANIKIVGVEDAKVNLDDL